MSPGLSPAPAGSACGPMQSGANATGRLMISATACTTGRSDCAGSGPLGRPKCESRMTLPPLSAISLMVGATRSMRVASATLPCSIGTLRSTRTSTRLPRRSARSRVRNAVIPVPRGSSDQLPHRHGGVGHAVGETPLVVVPRHHPHERAVHHLGLIHVEHRGMRVVIEVHRDVRLFGIAEDAFHLLIGGAFD